MDSPRNRKVPPPRPYNPTQMRPSVKRESDWEPVSLRDRDVSWELELELGDDEISVVRRRNELDDDVELPPITTWVDMNLPLPVPLPIPRPRGGGH